MADDEWMNEAKARLARAKTDRRRAGSIAARVEALLREIATARMGGKTWAEIGTDLSNGPPLNPDAVRIAYARAGKRGTTAAPAKRPPASPVSVTEPETTGSASDPIDDLFAPILDARDMRGRGVNTDEERHA